MFLSCEEGMVANGSVVMCVIMLNLLTRFLNSHLRSLCLSDGGLTDKDPCQVDFHNKQPLKMLLAQFITDWQ